ncbi:MAG TPA: hypothetical protein VD908_10275 [Cytophagales bacterium]|nr:hypothetical protein [Cytophagales bacterium]
MNPALNWRELIGMVNKVLLVMFFLSSVHLAKAQHEQHHKSQAESDQNEEDSARGYVLPMSHAFSLTLPMSRNGSGTGWLPDSSPMYGYMLSHKKWVYMFHGNLFIRYNKQDITEKGSRGDEKIDAPNWLMGMGQRRVGERGLFRFSIMMSLDPLIAGGSGYPLLFQSGETYKGKKLVDRQHPHDLFSELSVGYSHRFDSNMDLFFYLGYPGEPALGPVAFMHRVSALNNPDALLGHHWQDATHITFGVATIGFRYKSLKIEGSSFTGREPDEERYGFDKPRFDSYSFMFSINPNSNLAFQASQGFLKNPEGLGDNVKRTTASILYNFPLFPLIKKNYNFSTSLIWGYNNSGHNHQEHSISFEPAVQLNKWAIYGRHEWVQKSSEELDITLEEDKTFNIQAYTVGFNYTLVRHWNINFTLGTQGTFFKNPNDLYSIYGKNPLSAEVYLRINPSIMNMGKKEHGH